MLPRDLIALAHLPRLHAKHDIFQSIINVKKDRKTTICLIIIIIHLAFRRSNIVQAFNVMIVHMLDRNLMRSGMTSSVEGPLHWLLP